MTSRRRAQVTIAVSAGRFIDDSVAAASAALTDRSDSPGEQSGQWRMQGRCTGVGRMQVAEAVRDAIHHHSQFSDPRKQPFVPYCQQVISYEL